MPIFFPNRDALIHKKKKIKLYFNMPELKPDFRTMHRLVPLGQHARFYRSIYQMKSKRTLTIDSVIISYWQNGLGKRSSVYLCLCSGKHQRFLFKTHFCSVEQCSQSQTWPLISWTKWHINSVRIRVSQIAPCLLCLVLLNNILFKHAKTFLLRDSNKFYYSLLYIFTYTRHVEHIALVHKCL